MGHGAGESQRSELQLLPQYERSTYTRAAIDAVAGGVAGAVARTVVSPLDVIKIRFQVQLEPTTKLVRPSGLSVGSKYTGIIQAARDIVREEGIVGLWRGNIPALMLVVPYTAIQFVVVQSFKSHVAGSSKGGWPLHQLPGISSEQNGEFPEDVLKLNPAMSFLGGGLAGFAATIGSYPFDLLRTVLASQGEPKVYPNMRSAFKGIVQAKGWRGLYAGLTPALIEIVPYAGLQFGIYDTLKHQVTLWKKGHGSGSENIELSNLEHFFCGLTAGTISKTLCHPLDVVKKRFQVVGLARDPRYGERLQEKAYRNTLDALRRIVKSEGWVGLYKGTLPSVVKSAPSSATTFLVYEFLSNKLERWLQENGTSTS